MVNAPPTPPATTPAELQDEARTNPSTTATASPPPQAAPQSRPEQYQSMLLLIGEAVSAKDFFRLTRIAEEADIHVHTPS
jgi:COP9 signalosome complex subunit 8